MPKTAITAIVCPVCDRQGSTTKAVTPGIKIKCPDCHTVFRYLPTDKPTADDLDEPSFPAVVDVESLAVAAVSEPEPALPAPIPAAKPMRDCPDCGETILAVARKCRFCGSDFSSRASGRQAQHHGNQIVIHNNVGYHPGPRWSPGVAALLSFFFPGLGQMYKGQALNGIAWLFCTFIGYCLFIVPGLFLHVCCIIGAASGNPNR